MTRLPRSARAMLLGAALLAGGCTRTPQATPAGGPAVPQASARQAPAPAQLVLEAMTRFRAARAFEARMQLESEHPQAGRLEYVAPDRYRLQLPGLGTQVIVGGTLYRQEDGRTDHLPVSAELLAQWRDPLQLQADDQLQVEDLGADPLDGRPAHLYRVVHPDPARPAMRLWIGADGRPLRIEHRGRGPNGDAYRLQIDYTRFDDPTLRIDTP